jgi:membrane protein implicated in regulation of membrane protease activity
MKQKETMTPAKSTLMLGITALVLTVYVWFFLHAESQISIAILLVAAILAVILSR